MPINRCGDVHSNIVLMADIPSKPRTTVSKNQELRCQRTKNYGIKELGITVELGITESTNQTGTFLCDFICTYPPDQPRVMIQLTAYQ